MKRNFNFVVGNRFTDGLVIIISALLLFVFLREPGPPKISIHQAAKDGNTEAVKLDLADGIDVNAKDDNGRTPLHHVAEEGHKEIAELFIAAGADVNAKNNLGGTPLHEAAASGCKEIVELLVTKGADVNANIGGWTPLQLAVDEGHTEIAGLLREHGGKTAEELKAQGK
jgi:ankyrin repeat protein